MERIQSWIDQQRDIVSPGDLVRAGYCRDFILRLEQYEHNQIGQEDLLLYIRDLVLFTGKVKLPQSLCEIIAHSGAAHSLYVEGDREVNVLFSFPEWVAGKRFIDQVYRLECQQNQQPGVSAGDQMLRESTNFVDYRSLEQKIAVHTALRLPMNHTLMIALPTGGGKSLVTHMLAAGPGLTLVIVPTVALALDQKRQAEECIKDQSVLNGLFCYHGDIDSYEKSAMLHALEIAQARLIFTSPEAVMKNQQFRQLLDEAADKGYLNHVVLDEAHLVPDWGAYFRVDFQIFSVVLRNFRQRSRQRIRTYLLSATLSEEVVDSLFQLYASDGGNVQLRCDSLRPEPRFVFQPCSHFEQREKQVLDLVQLLPKPLILYVIEPKQAEHYHRLLQRKGYRNARLFTGVTKDSQRRRVLDDWKSNRVDIVVATSAFGIGIDKSNVRTILHACVPETLSRFYQEVGRAGRDGLPSLSVLAPYLGKDGGQGDLSMAHGMVSKNVLRVDKAIDRWLSLLHAPATLVWEDTLTVDTATAPESFTPEAAEMVGSLNESWNANLLLLLHRTGFLTLTDAAYKPDTKSYSVTFTLLRRELLERSEVLSEVLEPAREHEYQLQKSGYALIKQLVRTPKKRCWNNTVCRLFPLAQEHCSGCPVHSTGGVGDGSTLTGIRQKVGLCLPAAQPSNKLKRLMGSSYKTLLLRKPEGGGAVNRAAEAAHGLDLGALVVPDSQESPVCFSGLVLTYQEFHQVREFCPVLFSSGVLAVFNEDPEQIDALYRGLMTPELDEYRRVFFCRDDTYVCSQQKNMSEFVKGYLRNHTEV